MSIENPSTEEQFADMPAFIELEAKLIIENHPEWEDPAEFAEHAEEHKRLALEFHLYVSEHPEILKEYRADPDATIAKLKADFFQ